ncbi:MAG TPA: peptidyl-prolyl cis-trans isomerase [Anaerolineales bacterium]
MNLLAHPLHEYVFALPVGGVSEPFKYGPDIYIVKVQERTGPKPLAFEQVKESIRAELEARQHEQSDAEAAARLLNETRAKIYNPVIREMLAVEQATPAP